MIIFNEETKDIVSEKHICYYTITNGSKLILKEIVEVTLKHPQAKELAFITKTDERHIKEYDRREVEASASILLEAAQNNIKTIREEGE